MTSEDKSKIDELKKSLYSRTSPEIRRKRRLHFMRGEDTSEVSTDWEHPQDNPLHTELNDQYENHSISFFKKLLLGSVAFFLLAVGLGAYFLLNGSNIISANNIDVIVNGPVTIAGGDPLSFNIQVVNKNNIKLQQVDMSVEFPAGTVNG
jgi:hypothetical protein